MMPISNNILRGNKICTMQKKGKFASVNHNIKVDNITLDSVQGVSLIYHKSAVSVKGASDMRAIVSTMEPVTHLLLVNTLEGVIHLLLNKFVSVSQVTSQSTECARTD